MEGIYSWVKNLICCLCLLELLSHLVRNGEYQKYLRFFGGLILLLVIFSPAASLFSIGSSFEEALREAFAREEVLDLQMTQQALAGLKNQQIFQAYREEIKRQVETIAEAHNQNPLSVQIEMEEKDEMPAAILSVKVTVAAQSGGLNVFEETKKNETQERALQAIAAEIASAYGVDQRQVSVSVKE
ncbi:MAG: stage III sporulation protein AF [Eubacteriales bacterium]|nr:stage III sporulation protein AF [Eubacteriales bacterium]